jgi:hypothetical protein
MGRAKIASREGKKLQTVEKRKGFITVLSGG